MENNLDSYLYFSNKKKAQLPFFLQLLFLAVGGLLIVAFAILVNNEPKEADASLFSPLVALLEETGKEYQYKLLYGEQKRVIFKETEGNNQSIKSVNLGTNLTQTIASSQRAGFIGLLDNKTVLFLKDGEGLGKFIINKYDLEEKTAVEILAFQGPKTLATNELDQLVTISPDKTKLAITHETGIVIYTLKNENEVTVVENTALESCQQDKTCISYHQPLWITNNSLLVYQDAIDTKTPLIIDTRGNITAVLPNNLHDLATSVKGFPLTAVSDEALFYLEAKKTGEVLKETDTRYANPVWLGNEIVVFVTQSNVPTIMKTDKLGKKAITLKAFPTDHQLNDLITDATGENIFFLETATGEKNVNVSFYKMGLKENQPESFYSISKNL